MGMMQDVYQQMPYNKVWYFPSPATIYDWRNQAEDIWSFKGHSTSKTLKGQGRKEIFPGVSDRVTYMEDVRREEEAVKQHIHIIK
ncbi:hypothetical protein DVH05_020223 [Phytophthora capsici]|nr:hypothetical protein DVH05_020223 [Phytophthora capsici]